MRTHVLNTLSDLPLQRLPGALFHIFMAEQCLALGPAFNAFKQRARLIPCGFACGLRGIQMNMRLDKGRDD